MESRSGHRNLDLRVPFRVSVWILFLLLLNSVYCQEKIRVYAGEDILLSCSYNTSSNVFWRYEDGYNLCDIMAGKPELSDQHERFRDRTGTFPDLYSQGNFSLVLMNVSLTDTGPYECYIPSVKYRRQLELIVTVKPTEETTSGEAAAVTSPPNAGGNSVSMREHYHSSLLCIVLYLTLKTI